MEFKEFRKSCAEPAPLYLLRTKQDYLKKRVLETARTQVEEAARSFDWATYDLEKESESDLVNEARTLPWISPRRWIYVYNADRGGDLLRDYLGQPSQRTVLILEVNKKPAKWPTMPVIQMPERVDAVRWVTQRAGQKGSSIDRTAARTLVELVGEDFQRLDGELEKLSLLHLETNKITRESVLEMAFQSQNYDIFSLIGAIAAGRAETALVIFERLSETGLQPPQLLAMLYWNFRRLLVAKEMMQTGTPFREILRKLKIWSYNGREKEVRAMRSAMIRNTLSRLRTTERLYKTTSLDPKILLERLIVDTCLEDSV